MGLRLSSTLNQSERPRQSLRPREVKRESKRRRDKVLRQSAPSDFSQSGRFTPTRSKCEEKLVCIQPTTGFHERGIDVAGLEGRSANNYTIKYRPSKSLPCRRKGDTRAKSSLFDGFWDPPSPPSTYTPLGFDERNMIDLDDPGYETPKKSVATSKMEEFRKDFVQGLWSNTHGMRMQDASVNTSARDVSQDPSALHADISHYGSRRPPNPQLPKAVALSRDKIVQCANLWSYHNLQHASAFNECFSRLSPLPTPPDSAEGSMSSPEIPESVKSSKDNVASSLSNRSTSEGYPPTDNSTSASPDLVHDDTEKLLLVPHREELKRLNKPNIKPALDASGTPTDERPNNLDELLIDASCIPAEHLKEDLSLRPPAPSPTSAKGRYKAVVVIDLGTTNSGYAYTFLDRRDSVCVMRSVQGGDPGVSNVKCPTALLLKPDGSFHSFGYVARDSYHDLEPSQAKTYLYFERFKMKLYSTTLNLESTLHAANGQQWLVLDILAATLRYFKHTALAELSDSYGALVQAHDVHWVLTVPAIWRQPAKQMMRQAAYQAGLATPGTATQVLIALEPEAAAIYCRGLQATDLCDFSKEYTHNIFPSQESMRLPKATPVVHAGATKAVYLQPGDGYIVADCGGGTVDITVHKISDDGQSMREIHQASGGPYGSTAIDGSFEALLADLFTADFMIAFREKYPSAFVDLMVAFESRKRYANPYQLSPLNIALPYTFMEFHREHRGHRVECAVKKFRNKGISWTSQGMLRVSAEIMQSLFLNTLNGISRCITQVLVDVGLNQVSYLFLVGGFAASPMLQNHIRQTFGERLRIIIPRDVSLAVLKGAVLFGLQPNLINVRQCRFTYGIGVLNKFDPLQHPLAKKITQDGRDWCTDVFDKFVKAGDPIVAGHRVSRCYCPASAGQKEIVIQIYCSELENPKFVSDAGVWRCGLLRLRLDQRPDLVAKHRKHSKKDAKMTALEERREIETCLMFGDTELKIYAKDKTTGCEVRCDVDFFSHDPTLPKSTDC